MGQILPFPGPASSPQIGFTRAELKRIIDLYGRMVAAGLWRDYAVEFGRDGAAFWAFRRTAERPEYKIEKRPAAAQPPGPCGRWSTRPAWCVRRGDELGPVLAPLERRLMKAVNG